MSLFKKKDRSPLRRVGMALVPPAAFVAVPNTPPPTPISSKKKKSKVVVSPIIPSILGANATGRAVALGSSGEDIERLKIEYEAASPKSNQSLASLAKVSAKRNTPDEETETYAKITFRDPDLPRTSGIQKEQSHAQRNSTPSRRRSPNNLDASTPSRQSKHSQARNAERHGAKTEDSNNRSPARNGKKLNSKVGRNPVESISKKSKTSSRGELLDSPQKTPSRVTIASSPPSVFKDDVDADPSRAASSDPDFLEEKMRLKDEQTREMIMDLMQNPPTRPPPARDVDDHLDENPNASFYTEKDKELVKEVAALLKGSSMAGAEGVVLKQQIQDIIDENEVLKDTVERLNVELSRYHEKYGVNPDLEGARGSLELSSNAKWLTNVKFLSPLFTSYDSQLDAKDNVIAHHAEQFAELCRQMEAILRENEVLRKASEQVRVQPFVSQQKWNNLKEQNHLMLEEIQLQLQQLELMEKKAREMHVNHVEEVSKLAKRLALSDAECQEAENSRKKLKEKLVIMTDQHDRILAEVNEKISPEELARAMCECKNELEDFKEKNIKELKLAMSKIKETQSEKTKALSRVTELTSHNKQLQGEVNSLKENRSSLLNQIDDLQAGLDEAEDRELQCQLHLANVVRVAERAASERATYAAVAEKEQIASEAARRRCMREQWEMGKMEESLKRCKMEIASHNLETNDRLREVEEMHTGQLMQYERKMSHLKKLLEQKQQALDDVVFSKKQIENELETVWQAANSENRLMMDTLSRSNLLGS